MFRCGLSCMCSYVDGGVFADCTPTEGGLFFNPGVRAALVKVDCRGLGYCPDLDEVDVICRSIHTGMPTTVAILAILLALALLIIVVLSLVSDPLPPWEKTPDIEF